MEKIFGYARVSTIDQNLDTQIEVLQKAGYHQIFQDKISGLTKSRPELDKMLELLREGDTVIVARFSRLGRNRDHIISLVNEFAKKGILFKALDLSIDTRTPGGRLIADIFAALAQYDREMILEKTKAGQKLAAQNGKHVGRPTGVDDEKFMKVKKAYAKGLSILETVNLTGISLSSVKRYRKLIQKE